MPCTRVSTARQAGPIHLPLPLLPALSPLNSHWASWVHGAHSLSTQVGVLNPHSV